jgi:hypothetical protein
VNIIPSRADAIDVGCLVSHQAVRIRADVGLADVIAPKHHDIGLLVLCLREACHGKRTEQGNDSDLHVHLLHSWNANTFFQSRFMLTTIHFFALASSQALSSLPMCESRS